MPWKIWEPPWSNWSNLLLQPVSPLFFGVYILKSAAEDLNSNNLNIVSNYSLRGRLSNCFRLLLFSLECLNLWSKLLPSPDNWVKFLQDNFPLTLSLEPARIPTNFCLLRSLVVLQFPSCVRLFATPWTAAGQASLSFIISQSLLKLMSIESVIPSNQLILCHPLLLLPSIFPSIKVFCRVGPSHQVTKVLELRFSISPSNEYSVLISFRADWFYLLAVQGTLKSLLQHHRWKSSIFRC